MENNHTSIQEAIDQKEGIVHIHGWVHRERGSNKLKFINLRDSTNIIQCVIEKEKVDESESGESAMSYLGKTIGSDSPIVLVEDMAVFGSDLTFDLDVQKSAIVKIYNVNDELVKTINLTSDDTSAGENAVEWDGVADSGYKVPDGMYYYTVQTDSGFVKTPVSEEVSMIKNINAAKPNRRATSFLVIDSKSRLMPLAKKIADATSKIDKKLAKKSRKEPIAPE